jgi:hypothetical protein
MKNLYFSLTDPNDITRYAEVIAAFQYYSVKFETEVDGANVVIIIK